MQRRSVVPIRLMAWPLSWKKKLCYRLSVEKRTFEATAHDVMKRFAAMILTAFVLAATSGARSDAEAIRVAVQKTGTFAWELAVIRAHGLDKRSNLSIQAVELASPEAGKIALRSGNADIIISDWLWVSRERGLGAGLTFY